MTSSLLMSGGIDSAACLAFLLSRAHQVSPLFIDFGQPPVKEEYSSAEQITQHYGLKLEVIRLALPRKIDEGELPGRNALFVLLSLLAGRQAPDQIVLGIHSGTSYFDCSPSFAATCGRLVSELTDGRTQTLFPFLDWNKREIFDYAQSADVPIKKTYSCERASGPCKVCQSCKDKEILGC